MSDDPEDLAGNVNDESEGDDQRGPWVLALGALAIGGVAFSVEAYRALRDRRRGGEN